MGNIRLYYWDAAVLSAVQAQSVSTQSFEDVGFNIAFDE